MKVKKVKAPVRIDFAGGTTDIKYFAERYGGAVLNCSINKYVYGELISDDKKVSLEYHADIPTSSGLGTSGAMNLVWLALISKIKDKKGLAENVYKLEQSQGLVGGKQDQYAAALGGINLMLFNKNKVTIKKVKMNKKTIQKLEDSLVILYVGKPHFSGDANKLMIDNLKKETNVKALLEIKKIALEMKKALENSNLEKFAELLNKETGQRRQLAKETIPKLVQDYIDKGMKNGAVAAKVCGSGNGGSILFFGDKKKLKRTFKKGIIDFKFDWKGLQWF